MTTLAETLILYLDERIWDTREVTALTGVNRGTF